MDTTKPSLSCTWDQRKLPYMLKSMVCLEYVFCSPHSVGVHTPMPFPNNSNNLPWQKCLRNQDQSENVTYIVCVKYDIYIHIHIYTMGSVNNGQTYSREGGWYWGTFHPFTLCAKMEGGVLVYFYHMDEAYVLLGKQRGEGSWNNFLCLVPRPPTFFPFYLCSHIIHRSVRRTKNMEGLEASYIWMMTPNRKTMH